MFYRLNPLEVALEFEPRQVALGDTIQATILLTPKGDVRVRSGALELKCMERYEQRGYGQASDTYQDFSQSSWGVHASEVRTEKLVHSKTTFLTNERLRSGRTVTRQVSLYVSPTPPPHYQESLELQRDANSSWSFAWALVATLDVVRGRNAIAAGDVELSLPSPPPFGIRDRR